MASRTHRVGQAAHESAHALMSAPNDAWVPGAGSQKGPGPRLAAGRIAQTAGPIDFHAASRSLGRDGLQRRTISEGLSELATIAAFGVASEDSVLAQIPPHRWGRLMVHLAQAI